MVRLSAGERFPPTEIVRQQCSQGLLPSMGQPGAGCKAEFIARPFGQAPFLCSCTRSAVRLQRPRLGTRSRDGCRHWRVDEAQMAKPDECRLPDRWQNIAIALTTQNRLVTGRLVGKPKVITGGFRSAGKPTTRQIALLPICPFMRPESGPDLVAEVVCEIACFRRGAKYFDRLRRIVGGPHTIRPLTTTEVA
jgi:hypothetical protein